MLKPMMNSRFPIARSFERTQVSRTCSLSDGPLLTFLSRSRTVPSMRKKMPKKSRKVPIFLVSDISKRLNIADACFFFFFLVESLVV